MTIVHATARGAMLALALHGCRDLAGLDEFEPKVSSDAAEAAARAASGAGTSTSSSGGAGGGAPCALDGSPCDTGLPEPCAAGECSGGECVALASAPERACNAADDDCDGFIDEPASLAGPDGCGCDWRLFDGKHYRMCAPAPPLADIECGAKMHLAVVGSTPELAFLEANVVGATGVDNVFVGLRQAPSADTPATGWSWHSPGGLVSDFITLVDIAGAPASVEAGARDCACFVEDFFGFFSGWESCPCDGQGSDQGLVCEESTPDVCVDGTPCQRDKGCRGVIDCARDPLERCQAAPVGETCNGHDDDCNGVVDVDAAGAHACQCHTEFHQGAAYKLCLTPMPFGSAPCGPGYRLARIQTSAERVAVIGWLSEARVASAWIGVYQRTSATAANTEWVLLDGAAAAYLPWGASQPDNVGVAENDVSDEDCVEQLTSGQWNDLACSRSLSFVCEEL
jgi:hypothetical protein